MKEFKYMMRKISKKFDIITLNILIFCVLYIIVIFPFKFSTFGFDYFNNIKKGYGIDVYNNNYQLNDDEQKYIIHELNGVNIFNLAFFKVKNVSVIIPFDIKDGISYGKINIDVEIEKYDGEKIKQLVNSCVSNTEKVNKVDIDSNNISISFSRRLIGINNICKSGICLIFLNANNQAKRMFNFKLCVRFIIIIIILILINLLAYFVDDKHKNSD